MKIKIKNGRGSPLFNINPHKPFIEIPNREWQKWEDDNNMLGVVHQSSDGNYYTFKEEGEFEAQKIKLGNYTDYSPNDAELVYLIIE